MKCFSLFSGIGGFDLALKRQGHEIVGACEIDKYARSVYSRHFPEVPMWEDATKINPGELPDFEMLCGGFPCQAFSIAGKRFGFEESRGTLFFEIARIAREKRPGYIFLENVKGLLSHDNQRTIITILKTLDELGYDTEWQVINSLNFVPQNRERIYIIGHLREKPTRKVFPLLEVCEIDDRTFDKAQGKREWVRSPYTRTINANYAKGGGNRTMIAWSKSTRDGGIIESRIKENEANTLNTGQGCRTMSSATFIKEDMGYRQLTPLECERLQSFPDNWTDGLSDTQRYKCVGNAVTVSVIEYILSNF
ncbi:MAG TPA: DNA (cytosine-5-)-methyltransferase [Nitrosarchaeum sp.]|nr:DNA (cytosine-5-)-methyltransferase [Nitrosarchaeum sp.]